VKALDQQGESPCQGALALCNWR